MICCSTNSRGDGVPCREPYRVGQTGEDASTAGRARAAHGLVRGVELYKLLRPHWKGLSPPTTDTGELEGYGRGAREADRCHEPRRRCSQPTHQGLERIGRLEGALGNPTHRADVLPDPRPVLRNHRTRARVKFGLLGANAAQPLLALLSADEWHEPPHLQQIAKILRELIHAR
jgi:hypothetical protein